MKVLTWVVSGMVMVGLVGSASAGFSIPKIGGDKGGDTPAGGGTAPAVEVDPAALKSQLDEAMSSVAVARKLIVESQMQLADALGVKTQADAIMSSSKVVTEGGAIDVKDAKGIEASKKASEGLNVLISEEAAKGAELDAIAKEKIGNGYATFAKGIAAEGVQIGAITVLANQIHDAGKGKGNPMKVAKIAALAAPAAMLASLVPGDVKESCSTAGVIYQLCKKNEIKAEAIDIEKYMPKAAE